jgi:hypothetical protein
VPGHVEVIVIAGSGIVGGVSFSGESVDIGLVKCEQIQRVVLMMLSSGSGR